jgi:hypothetical protein
MSRFDRGDEPADRMESPFPRAGAFDANLLSHSGRAPGTSGLEDQLLAGELRIRVRERDRTHMLPESNLKTLADIGMFRALAFEDLVEHRYGRDRTRTEREMRTLTARGLVSWRKSYPEQKVYVTLSRLGHRTIADSQGGRNPNQKLYHGFVNTREARHDGALYRLYQEERRRVEHLGGRVQRVVLDFELRGLIQRKLARLASLPAADQAGYRQDIAGEHGLKVVNGRIRLPDLRLEYEGPDQELTKVDLELVTTNYRHEMLAAKAGAGFVMYAFAEDAARIRPAMQDPGIMQDLLSL